LFIETNASIFFLKKEIKALNLKKKIL